MSKGEDGEGQGNDAVTWSEGAGGGDSDSSESRDTWSKDTSKEERKEEGETERQRTGSPSCGQPVGWACFNGVLCAGHPLEAGWGVGCLKRVSCQASEHSTLGWNSPG